MPQKLCFLTHIKNPHTTSGGQSKAKRLTSTSEEIMSLKYIFFYFKLHCIFCGGTCTLKSDPCNPSRWRSACLCKTASHGTGLSFKDSILEICNRRKDTTWANQVKQDYKVQSSVIYMQWRHVIISCRKNFMLFKIKQANTCASRSTDLAFDKLVDCMVVKDAAKQSLQIAEALR